MDKPLDNMKHEMFCLEYAKCLNGTQAYKKVYNSKTDETAKVNASKLLTNSNVSSRLKYLIGTNQQGAEKDLRRYQAELEDLAYMDATEILEIIEEGHMVVKTIRDLPRAVRICIKSFKVTTNTRKYHDNDEEVEKKIEVAFWSKEKCLELLGRFHGAFNDKLNVKSETIEDLIKGKHV